VLLPRLRGRQTKRRQISNLPRRGAVVRDDDGLAASGVRERRIRTPWLNETGRQSDGQRVLTSARTSPWSGRRLAAAEAVDVPNPVLDWFGRRRSREFREPAGEALFELQN
jgi:hypothetical protein